MAEVGEILIRCSVLAGRATNGILGDEEREIIQDEIDELHEEIDRIYLTTNFNGIKVFGEGGTDDHQGGLPYWMTMDRASQESETLGSIYTDNNKNYAATIFDISRFNGNLAGTVGKGFSTTCCTCSKRYCIEFTDDTDNQVETVGSNNYVFKIGLKGATTPQDVYDRILKTADGNALRAGTGGGHKTIVEFADGQLIVHNSVSGEKPQKEEEWGLMNAGIYTGLPKSEPNRIELKIGETSTTPDRLKIDKPDVSTKNLGIENVFVLTQDEALEARDAYKNAGEFISSERGRIGAYQNRLAHTSNVHTETIENTTAANSRIEDTDMAKEFTEYTSNNILTQAAQSMLAQAKSNPESILSLLHSDK